MTAQPSEETQTHTRVLKCALEVEDCRAYWSLPLDAAPKDATKAFEEYWFGARSLARVRVLLTNMRARFDTYPAALKVLRRWVDMAPDERRIICHWHMQLADPLYRRFTGTYLAERRDEGRAEVTRDLVVGWVAAQGQGRWTSATRLQFASKLLSSAFAAGIVTANRDPRPLTAPRTSNAALGYLVYLLRETTFEGTLLSNPYMRSVGLDGGFLEERLRGLPALSFKRQGDLVDFGWRHHNLEGWADGRWPAQDGHGGAR